nr:hypothetical protein [Candidatus Sigynarchaeota archaeon]
MFIDKTYCLINHLRGFLYRTLHLVQHGIWPVHVFGGLFRGDASETNLAQRAISN